MLICWAEAIQLPDYCWKTVLFLCLSLDGGDVQEGETEGVTPGKKKKRKKKKPAGAKSEEGQGNKSLTL